MLVLLVRRIDCIIKCKEIFSVASTLDAKIYEFTWKFYMDEFENYVSFILVFFSKFSQSVFFFYPSAHRFGFISELIMQLATQACSLFSSNYMPKWLSCLGTWEVSRGKCAAGASKWKYSRRVLLLPHTWLDRQSRVISFVDLTSQSTHCTRCARCLLLDRCDQV